MRQVDLARWCFTRFGIRPDRSIVGRVLKGADHWTAVTSNDNTVRVRGGAYPQLEQAMVRRNRNAGPAGVPLTLMTIRNHVATFARGMDLCDTFRCSVGWVRRAMRRNGIRCRSAVREAADEDHAAVCTCHEQLLQLLMCLSVRPRDVYNFDKTALYLSVLPRKTYGAARAAGRKLAKERLAVGLLVNVDGSHAFCPLVIHKAKRPRDFLPDYDSEELAMPAVAFVAIDDDQPTCAEPGEDPLALEPAAGYSDESWEAPTTMQTVYDDDNPESREARRYVRAASEMLIGYTRATGITPRNLCVLFEFRNPIIVDRMERASPAMNLNTTLPPAPQPAASPAAAPAQAPAATTAATTPRRRGRVLPA
ncbi:unnamed protein product [Closterium sp. Naga37s-1]|nr:unnamed protein product [Closterium sp. Naga37s-1]